MGCILIAMTEKKKKNQKIFKTLENRMCLELISQKIIMSGSFNMSTVEKKLLNLLEITLTRDTFLQLYEL